MSRLRLSMLLLLTACSSAPHIDDHDDHDDAEDAGEHGRVHLSPEAVAAARLTEGPAIEGTLTPELAVPARVALDPRHEAVISAWIGGQVDQIKVRTGDTVRTGQTLGTVQSPELGEAIAAYRTARARDHAADARLERLRRLEADGVTSHSQVLQSEADHAEAEGAREASEERLRILGVDPAQGDPHVGEHYVSHVPVRSPIAGTVLSADASVGRQVKPGDTLFHVGDLRTVWLLLDVFERDLSSVAVDQTVRFTTEAWPDVTFTGTVAQVGNWVEPTSRTIEVRVVVDNADGRLKPNMFATATLSVARPGSPTGVVVPRDAVQPIDGQSMVFVVAGPGEYDARPVTVGARTSAQALLSSGVEPGEIIVQDGAFALRSELEKGELGEGHAH